MYNFRVGNGGHAQLEQICLPLSNVCFRQPPALSGKQWIPREHKPKANDVESRAGKSEPRPKPISVSYIMITNIPLQTILEKIFQWGI